MFAGIGYVVFTSMIGGAVVQAGLAVWHTQVPCRCSASCSRPPQLLRETVIERDEPGRVRAVPGGDQRHWRGSLGMIDLFIIWWLIVLAIGSVCSTAGRPRRSLVVHGCIRRYCGDRRDRHGRSPGVTRTFRKKILIGVGVVVCLAALAGANFYFKRDDAARRSPSKPCKNRDLEAIVSASGKIQAKRYVDMSAVQMGRVTRLAVEEGDRVKAGQFLLEIDPNSLRGTVERSEASVAAARSSLAQARVNVETAKPTSRWRGNRPTGSASYGSRG